MWIQNRLEVEFIFVHLHLGAGIMLKKFVNYFVLKIITKLHHNIFDTVEKKTNLAPMSQIYRLLTSNKYVKSHYQAYFALPSEIRVCYSFTHFNLLNSSCAIQEHCFYWAKYFIRYLFYHMLISPPPTSFMHKGT